MHVMEVALFANFVNQRRQSDEPLPERWPHPRRSRVARAALAGAWAVGIAAIAVGLAVVG